MHHLGFPPITGLRDTVTDSRGTTSYVYDERDRLISYTYPDGKAINYTYNLVGDLTSLTTPSGTVYYSYDEWNRLKTVTDGDDVTSYFYDGVSNLT
ncbi:MAG: RHS repeat protein [Hydrococcus sp. SU_1_0]|nr:RHS repeat protein [Hydrococcus sp. SU_1_0]